MEYIFLILVGLLGGTFLLGTFAEILLGVFEQAPYQADTQARQDQAGGRMNV